MPIAFADREWTEFVFRNLYGNYAKGFDEAEPRRSARAMRTPAPSDSRPRASDSSRSQSTFSTPPTAAATPVRGRPGAGATGARPRALPHFPSEALRAGELPRRLELAGLSRSSDGCRASGLGRRRPRGMAAGRCLSTGAVARPRRGTAVVEARGFGLPRPRRGRVPSARASFAWRPPRRDGVDRGRRQGPRRLSGRGRSQGTEGRS